MNLKKTVKKVAALGIGVSMVGATLLGAMATADLGNFPTMFINEEGKFDGIFVVGKNSKAEDIIGQNMLVSALQAVAVKKTHIEGTSTTTTVSGGYELGNNDWYLNRSANNVDSQLSKVELPELLMNGNYEDNEGDNKQTEGYTQKIYFNDGRTFDLRFDQDKDEAPDANVYLYFKKSSSVDSYNYTLKMDSDIDVSNASSASMSADLEGTTLSIMGRIFNIVDIKFSGNDLVELELLGGEQVSWLSQGEVVTTTIDGVDHTVEMVDVTETASTGEITACGFLVDGQSAWVDKGTTETVNGVVLGVTDGKAIHSAQQDTDVCKVSIGANSILFKDGAAEMKLNDADISDVTEFMAKSEIEYVPATSKFTGFSYKVSATGENMFLSIGDELVDPVFETFKIVFADFVEGEKETIEWAASGKTGTFSFSNRDNMNVELDFKANTGGSIYWGDTTTSTDVDEMIYFENDSCQYTSEITECEGARFLVSSSSTKFEAHLMEISDIDTVNNKIDIKDLTYGTETESLTFTDGATNSLTLSGVDDTIQLRRDNGINFTSLGDGYITDGVQSNHVKMKTANDGFVYINTTDSTFPEVQNMSFVEYLDSGSVADTEMFDLITESFEVGANYDSTDSVIEFFLDDGLLASTTYTFGAKDLSADDDDNKKTISHKGTLFTYDDDSSKQSVVVEHPKLASYARVFIAPTSAEATTSAEGTFTSEVQQIGVNQYKLDTEVADVTAVNIVAVGGPCANSVVAALMGNPAECYSAMGIEAGQGLIKLFEDATTGKVALVVAGQTAEDTRYTSQIMATYNDFDLMGMELIASTVSEASLDVMTKAEALATMPAEEMAEVVEEMAEVVEE